MIVDFTLTVLAVSIAVCAWRLMAGPTLPDRVVALDLVATLCVGVIALVSIQTSQPMILVVAIVIALVMFLGTAAFAMYIEKRARP